jgi:hypothetical protein
MGNLNSLESYGTAVIRFNTGISANKMPYSYQVIQVNGFVTVCLNLEMLKMIHGALVRGVRENAIP